MNDYAVEYSRNTTELEKSIYNCDSILDTKWFNDYKRAYNFAKKHLVKVYEAYEIIERNQRNIRNGRTTIV